MKKKAAIVAVVVLYACAARQFIRFYLVNTVPYLNPRAYLSGHERLPFQERIFPILFLKPLTEPSWISRHLGGNSGSLSSARGPEYLLSLAAFAVAIFYTQRLYSILTKTGLLSYLVFPTFLFTCMWTYAIHSEANFFYPYDLPALAFFTAGLYYVYARRFFPLLAVVAVGTTNRETTLFLIILYLIDAASSKEPDHRFDPRLISWWRAALLAATWVAIKLALAHRFAGNDASESFLRIRDNLHQLRPRLLPALLNLCGYTLPIVVIFQRYLEPMRFRKYLLVVPVWIAVMFCSGVLVETRIYGELCSFSAIAVVLILEQTAALHWNGTPGSDPVRLSSSPL